MKRNLQALDESTVNTSVKAIFQGQTLTGVEFIITSSLRLTLKVRLLYLSYLATRLTQTALSVGKDRRRSFRMGTPRMVNRCKPKPHGRPLNLNHHLLPDRSRLHHPPRRRRSRAGPLRERTRRLDPRLFPLNLRLLRLPPPLLDSLDATLAEIAYALDVLRADGITLYTRYGPGNRYLGHPDFIPIWAALSARAAVAFIHPTHLADTNLVNTNLPQPMIDYPHETIRAAVDLIMTDRLRQHPGCKIILSHAGGTLPYLTPRAAYMLPDCGLIAKPAEDFLADARTFYYDTALSTNPLALDLLRQFAAPGHILFGTDFPYAPQKSIVTLTWMWDGHGGVEAESRMSIDRGNALALFPRLRTDSDRGRDGGGEN